MKINITICLGTLIGIIVLTSGCENALDNLRRKSVATLDTKAITNPNAHWAQGGGIIKHNGNVDIIHVGVCWDTISSPKRDGSTDFRWSESISDTFSVYMNGLKDETTYFARAFVSNAEGRPYGQNVTFTTPKKTCNLEINAMEYDTVKLVFDQVICSNGPSSYGSYQITATGNDGGITFFSTTNPLRGYITPVMCIQMIIMYL
ncbi:MAG: hypothetical protein IIA45_15650 [Bacteroidetes bacterium]|nr:hypothetical protein [Bacteroidota bacterium]